MSDSDPKNNGVHQPGQAPAAAPSPRSAVAATGTEAPASTRPATPPTPTPASPASQPTAAPAAAAPATPKPAAPAAAKPTPAAAKPATPAAPPTPPPPPPPNPLPQIPLPFQGVHFAEKGFHADATVTPDQVVNAAKQMDKAGFALDTITGVDWMAQSQMEVVYDFFHPVKGLRAVVRTRIPRDNPELDTISPVFPGANWHERETHDFFGIRFAGHPDLSPFLLPEDATYHPLRKDFPGAS